MAAAAHRARMRTQPPGFAFYLASITLILLCVQVMVYVLVLRETIGPFSIFGSAAPHPSLGREPLAVVLDARDGERTAARVTAWRDMADEAGIRFESASLEALPRALGRATVVVLPHAAALDAATARSLLSFVDAGHGLVATGPLVTRRDDGSTSFELLTELTGASRFESVAAPDTWIAFRGTPRYFSGLVPAGARLPVPQRQLTVADAPDPDAFWCDWRLRPARGGALATSAVAVHRSRGQGRVVWLGFGEPLRDHRAAERQSLERYLTSSLQWAARQPVALLATWPEGRPAAVLAAQTVEDDARAAAGAARILSDAGIPAHAFLSSSATADAGAVAALARLGEVGFSGDGGEPFLDQPRPTQAHRLRSGRERMATAAAAEVVGYAPPQGLSDATLVAALDDASFEYYLDETAITRAVPEAVEFAPSALFPLQRRSVLKIFHTQADDIEAFAEAADGDPAAPFLRDLRRIADIGGLYTLKFRSDLLGAAPHGDVLRRIAQAIRTEPVWTPTGKQLARWWSAHSHVEVAVRQRGPRRLALDIANLGQRDLDDAAVFVHLPYRPRAVRLRPTVLSLEPPRHFLTGHGEMLRIDLPRLAAQASSSYLVDLEE